MIQITMNSTQVALDESGDRKLDKVVQMSQNGKFIPLFMWYGSDEVLMATYANYSDGVWHGLVWPGGATQVKHNHYRDPIMSAMASQISGATIVYSTVCPGADERNIKAPYHWPLRGKFTGDRGSPRTKKRLRGKCFHLMTSS